MNPADFNSQFAKLVEQIKQLPDAERGKLEHLAEETKQRHDRMKKTIGDLQDSLDYLRLSVKYLVFDLEATRRENKQLREMLESSTKPDSEANED